MWTLRTEPLPRGYIVRLLDADGSPLSYGDVLALWCEKASFCTFFNQLLGDSPYAAFRWETPPLTIGTTNRPFEFVLLDSPELEREPEQTAFAKWFSATPDDEAVAVPNLGGDAILVVPRPVATASSYVHLARFVRNAPESQQQALWKLIGESMRTRLSDEPVWLSTAGAGVAWLHVRLDNRPKYYGHAPYRSMSGT